MNPRPSSRLLVLAAAGVVVVVCGAVTAALLLVREPTSNDLGAGSFDVGTDTYVAPDTYYETDTYTSPPAEPTVDPLDGFEQVTGPGGMTTHIPAGWPTAPASGPGAMQADDPSGTSTMLRYGGSTTPESDTYQVHLDYAAQFAATRTGYSQLRLDRTTVRGMSAVDWEFEFEPQGDVRRHVRSVYWLSQGYEYFVYVSAPVDRWAHAQEILDVMLDNATP